ncbi:MAG: hypothetical protein ACQER1_18005 [Armatimonadota bacterium]
MYRSEGRRLNSIATRFRPSETAIILTVPFLLLSWNLCWCLYYGLSGKPLLFFRTEGGGPAYHVIAPSVFGHSHEVVALSDICWAVFILNLSALGILATGTAAWYVMNRRRREEAARVERRQQRRPARSERTISQAAGPNRLHVISEKSIRAQRRALIRFYATVGLAVLLLMPFAVSSTLEFAAYSFFAGFSGWAIWAFFKRGHGLVLIYDEESLVFQRNGLPVWRVRWDQVVGWHRERWGGTTGVKCIVLRCADHSTRRIDVGFLGLPVSFYSKILGELVAHTGKEDETPPEYDHVEQEMPFWVKIGLIVLILIIYLIVNRT